jgi:hypothetical protein
MLWHENLLFNAAKEYAVQTKEINSKKMSKLTKYDSEAQRVRGRASEN